MKARQGSEAPTRHLETAERHRLSKQGLHLTRMEHLPGEGYYSVKGYSLRDGLRAAIGDRD